MILVNAQLRSAMGVSFSIMGGMVSSNARIVKETDCVSEGSGCG